MRYPQDKEWNSFWNKQTKEDTGEASWSKRRIIFLLEPYLKVNQRVLDAGCGSGFFSRYFCDLGIETISLDYSDAALDMTKQKTAGRSKLVHANLLSDDLSQMFHDKMDIIFSDGLFEHFSFTDQDKIMQNFISTLKQGGMLITFVPNRWSPWQLIRPFIMSGIEEKPFDLKQVMSLSQRNNLEVIAKGGVNTFPFRFSLEGRVAAMFGMLLYTVARKR